MNKNYETFKNLHENDKPLILYNCWNVSSAKSIEKQNAKAIATSSYAIADSLGYEDKEQMSFSLLYNLILKIKESTTLPLSVDIETGYSNNVDEVVNHILSLVKLGVVAINLEDQLIGSDSYQLVDTHIQCKKIKRIKNVVTKEGYSLFINARTDVFLKETNHTIETVNEALQRCEQYKEAGADCIFVPGLSNLTLIQQFVEKSVLPVNVMVTNLDTDYLESLYKLNVNRISFGPMPYMMATKDFEERLSHIYRNNL